MEKEVIKTVQERFENGSIILTVEEYGKIFYLVKENRKSFRGTKETVTEYYCLWGNQIKSHHGKLKLGKTKILTDGGNKPRGTEINHFFKFVNAGKFVNFKN